MSPEPPITCHKCAAEHPATSFAAGYISAVGQCQQCDEKPAAGPFDNADDLIAYLREPHAPNPNEVICPACARQFRAIPENVQAELDRMSAENEALRAAQAEIGNLLPGYHYMDPPDGGDVSIVEQVRRMSVDAARYRILAGIDVPAHSTRWSRWEVRYWNGRHWEPVADMSKAIDAVIAQAKDSQ